MALKRGTIAWGVALSVAVACTGQKSEREAEGDEAFDLTSCARSPLLRGYHEAGLLTIGAKTLELRVDFDTLDASDASDAAETETETETETDDAATSGNELTITLGAEADEGHCTILNASVENVAWTRGDGWSDAEAGVVHGAAAFDVEDGPVDILAFEGGEEALVLTSNIGEVVIIEPDDARFYDKTNRGADSGADSGDAARRALGPARRSSTVAELVARADSRLSASARAGALHDAYQAASAAASSDSPSRAAAMPLLSHRTNLDVAFVLDTTGSMGGEIREAKERIRQISAALRKSRSGGTVRIGVVAFRDRGTSEAYLTKVSPFTSDVEQTASFLSALTAGGGGDGPEDVVSGISAALTELSWAGGANTDRQVFLIGDAPPHLDYPRNPVPSVLIQRALDAGIVLNTIGCRSLDKAGIKFFQQLAYGTEGRYDHIGQVRLGAEKNLSETLIETLEGPAEHRATRARLSVAPMRSPSVPVPATGLSGVHVGLEHVPGEGWCALRVRLPERLALSGAPQITRSSGELFATVTLRNGGGEDRYFRLGECVDAKTPVHIEFGGSR